MLFKHCGLGDLVIIKHYSYRCMKEEGMSFLLEAKFIIYSNLLISES